MLKWPTAIWLMSGLAATASSVIFTDPYWKVQNVADFNGDGKSDLLWFKASTGQTAIWSGAIRPMARRRSG